MKTISKNARLSLVAIVAVVSGVNAFAMDAKEAAVAKDIEERAEKIIPIKEFGSKTIAILDRLMDISPARNILWGEFCEERGESTKGLRAENKASLRLFMNRDAKFDSNLWSSDVHRPIGYSMPSICNVADNENAPTSYERKLKGEACAKFFKAVYNAQYYPVDKYIKASELLAQKPDEGKQIYKEVFGEEYVEPKKDVEPEAQTHGSHGSLSKKSLK